MKFKNLLVRVKAIYAGAHDQIQEQQIS